MWGASQAPTEQPTRTTGSDVTSSTAAQDAWAISSMVTPASAFGDRPYPGRSMPIVRYHVEKWAIWYSQQLLSIGFGWRNTDRRTVGAQPLEVQRPGDVAHDVSGAAPPNPIAPLAHDPHRSSAIESVDLRRRDQIVQLEVPGALHGGGTAARSERDRRDAHRIEDVGVPPHARRGDLRLGCRPADDRVVGGRRSIRPAARHRCRSDPAWPCSTRPLPAGRRTAPRRAPLR